MKFEAESASDFVDIVLKYHSPSIVDIGCGGKYFNKKGIKNLLGIDGAPSAQNEFLLAKDKNVIFDLAQKYNFKEKYDLALCLEVAEHLEEKDADNLVETIISASDDIIFTAAGSGTRSEKYWTY